MAGTELASARAVTSVDPTLANVLQNEKLRWVFVGGKGGSGKTTVCCSVALRLAEVRRSVLLFTTDPSHSVSHTFEQDFGRKATKVKDVDNLFVVEYDPERVDECVCDVFAEGPNTTGMKKMLTDALDSIPGVKLALVVYAEIIKMTTRPDPEYDVVVFDTVFGGQTAFSLDCTPDALEAIFSTSRTFRQSFMPFLRMLNQAQSSFAEGLDEAFAKFSEILDTLKNAKSRLRSPEQTTFLAVCTPDFLSVYETERMIQRLCERQIDCHNVVVNQSLVNVGIENCHFLEPKQKSQAKYLQQIQDLYEDFHVVEVPLVGHEIKGSKLLKEFSEYLFK